MGPRIKNKNLFSWHPLLLAIGFCLVLWVLWLGAQQVLADDPEFVPNAPGSISGIVTDISGLPLSGIEVRLYQSQPGYWYNLRVLTTDANGAYKAAALSTGIYHVGFRDPQQRYAFTYYTNATTVESAADIPVGGNDVTGINIQLATSGGISGTISFTGTLSANGCFGCVPISILHQIDGQWRVITSVGPRGPSGVYSVTALSPGVYRVCTDYNVYFYPFNSFAECYDNIASGVDHARDVTVVAGQITTNIDIVLGDGADLATLGGRVISASGQPLEQIDVTVQPWLTSVRAIAGANNPNTFYGGGFNDSNYHTKTDAQGNYQVTSLPVGDYVVAFADPYGPYLTQYYKNNDRPEFADRIRLGSKEQRLDIDVTLRPGGEITGRVQILNQLLSTSSGVGVILFPDVGTSPRAGGPATVDPVTGVYTSGGLLPGVYRVLAYATFEPGVYLSSYYGGVNYEQALTVTVQTGEIKPNIDVSIEEGGRFDGVIGGQVTDQYGPLSGIKVLLFSETYGIWNRDPMFYTYTDAVGHYLIGGLADGFYRLRFSDPSEKYVTTSLERSLWLVNSQPISNVNIALQRGGAISGHVALHSGTPVNNMQVLIYSDVNGLPDLSDHLAQTIDANGYYTVPGLPPGVYRVCFDNINTCYHVSRQPSYIYDATKISVSAGSTITGIDMMLGSAGPGRLYLPQIAR